MLHRLESVKNHRKKYGIFPTYRECAQMFGVHSMSSVKRLLQQRCDEWVIVRMGRSFAPAPARYASYESVQAWVFADNVASSTINLEQYVWAKEWVFIVRVAWDSMINAGILSWDHVVVDYTRDSDIWDIVIAVYNWEQTIKYLWEIDNRLCLIPANPAYQILYPQWAWEIQWVIVWLLRTYE